MIHITLTTAGEDEWLGGVSCDGPDIVRVSIIGVLSLQSVVVEHSHLAIILLVKVETETSVDTCISSDPVTTQFFLGTNIAALTGRSQTSKLLTSCWDSWFQM